MVALAGRLGWRRSRRVVGSRRPQLSRPGPGAGAAVALGDLQRWDGSRTRPSRKGWKRDRESVQGGERAGVVLHRLNHDCSQQKQDWKRRGGDGEDKIASLASLSGAGSNKTTRAIPFQDPTQKTETFTVSFFNG